MFVNAYEFELFNTATSETVPVALRLTTGAQIKLKKKWNEGTTETLFGAIDDVERFADVMTHALNFKGNENKIKDGAELLDLMAENGMLGMAAKQKIITDLGYASGIFSQAEAAAINSRAGKLFGDTFGGDDEGDEKN